ncbi:hypothetical protein Clacol_010409 [Clathrus columnatus]|uniref:Uncharacterized protein n=1 Tax=Clathrus columnatus TaxID=1419009 RepID=A0AAV5ASK0_9AGAM|nr:hypothetical protein Clacol_010409 [Clathrus columnatus]
MASSTSNLVSAIQPSQLDACLAVAERQDSLGQKVKAALDIIYLALEQYGEGKISLSFNGGKDCTSSISLRPHTSTLLGTVLLHLYAAALHNRHNKKHAILHRIPSLYIAPPSPFPDLESFISESETKYNLSLFRQSGLSGMKHALQVYKDKFPVVEAILIGIRRTDPHGGSTYNTFPNPALLIKEEDTNEPITKTPLSLNTGLDIPSYPDITSPITPTTYALTHNPIILDTPNHDMICRPFVPDSTIDESTKTQQPEDTTFEYDLKIQNMIRIHPETSKSELLCTPVTMTTEAGETEYVMCSLQQRPIILDTPDKDTVCKPLPTDTDADTASFPTRPPVIFDTPDKDTICKPLPTPPSSVSISTPISSNKTRRYRPAYELEDERLERAGRGPSKPVIDDTDETSTTYISGDSLPQSPQPIDLSTLSESLESIYRRKSPLPPSSELPTPAPERENDPIKFNRPKAQAQTHGLGEWIE